MSYQKITPIDFDPCCSHETGLDPDPAKQTSRRVRQSPDGPREEVDDSPEIGQRQGHRVQVPVDGESCSSQ